jgi:hypothetical protein
MEHCYQNGVTNAKLGTQAQWASKGDAMPELSAPRTITFIIAVVIAVVAAVLHYGHVSVPYLAHSGFTLLLVGFLILAAGNLLRNV